MRHVMLYLLVAVAFLHSNYASWLAQGREHELTGLSRFYAEGEGEGEGEGEEGKEVNCTGVTGNICSEDVAKCSVTYLCIPNNPPIEAKCPEGQTCNKGQCSTTPSTMCEYKDLKFKCSSEGVFPEPSSCKKYNYCLPPGNGTVTQANCPSGWGYNVANTLCDKKLTNNMCQDADRAVPRCTTAGQNAALKGSTSYYYICLPYSDTDATLYPNIYRCPGNTKYAGNYICR